MSSPEQRQVLMNLVQRACDAGARRHRACAVIGMTDRTLQRWMNPLQVGDRRSTDKRVYSRPPNKLSDAEREAALGVLNSQEYKDLPPSQTACPAWPTRACTWPANRPCTGCCTRLGK